MSPGQRRGVLALCLISLLVVVLVIIWRCLPYPYLDTIAIIFASLAILHSILLVEISSPGGFALLARDFAIITTGYLMLPTRFLPFAILMTFQSLITFYRAMTFFNLDEYERLSILTVTILLYLTGTVVRW